MSHYVLLRYLSIALITRVLLCSAAIAGLLELLSLLEQTTLILQRHLGLWGVFYYAILRFPFLISNALPPGMLIGTLFMLTQMTFSSEIPTLRAAGMSSFTLYKYLIPATLLIGFFGFFPIHSRPEENNELPGDPKQIYLPDVNGKGNKTDVNSCQNTPHKNRNDQIVSLGIEPNRIKHQPHDHGDGGGAHICQPVGGEAAK